MPDRTDWHTRSVEDVLNSLDTSMEGLGSKDVVAARQRAGSNDLPPPPAPSPWSLLITQFRSPLIYILIVACAFAFAVGERKDALVILAVIVLNALIGYRQEHQSNQAIRKLLALAPEVAHVIRDGAEREIPLGQVVVGDIVVLTTGDRVPADGRWVETINLRLSEAALTGESVPVSKQTGPVDIHTPYQEQHNMAWRGTTVVGGRGVFVVTAVGVQTKFGAIVSGIQLVDRVPTPFQSTLSSFSRRILVITLLAGVLVFLLGLVRDLPFQQLSLLVISMIVSIIPEGLPVVITLAMAWGMWAMAKRQAIVRKLSAVETLGAVTVVATDKTGTLTYGEMMVEKVWVDGQHYHFSGRGFAPEGDILLNGQKVLGREMEGLSLALRLGAMNNDSRFTIGDQGQRQAIGDPTELALIVAAGKAGWSKYDLDMAHPRLGEFPFEYEKKYMVTWHRTSPEKLMVTLKGAPREVLALCNRIWTASGVRLITDADRSAVMETYERWSEEALRGLAAAYQSRPASGPDVAVEPQFILSGLFGMSDALRPEAAGAIQTMQRAGIRVLMVTGDYQKTGMAIGQRLGLVTSTHPHLGLDGSEVDKLSDPDLRRRLALATVGTRLTPEHKRRIAVLFQQGGDVVAMTGDGINDVPALSAADVGVAVGQNASDAAKEVADIVLLDGNFQSITAAVEEGRRIYRNIRRVMFYLLASNIGELVLVVAALLVGWPLPLLPTQIIWLNAVTDPFLGVALAREPLNPHAMEEAPRSRHEPIVPATLWRRIVLTALGIGAGTLAVLAVALAQDRPQRETYALTLTAIAFAQWVTAFTARSSRHSTFTLRQGNPNLRWAFLIVLLMQASILYIPPLANAFSVAPLGWMDWLLVVAAAIPVLLIEEIQKALTRRQNVSTRS